MAAECGLPSRTVVWRAASNIALVKYWGKRDEQLILPLNSSLSLTLDSDLCATTLVRACPDCSSHRFYLNGSRQAHDTARMQACIDTMYRLAGDVSWSEDRPDGNGKQHFVITREMWPRYRLYIVSRNNFPTAAGLASSAAGFACLVAALAALFGVTTDLSGIARLGSGSACRSIFGGLVEWQRGEAADGSDSIAIQRFPREYWPELRVVILVTSHSPKKDSSTEGMRRSVATSELLETRWRTIVPRRITEVVQAFRARDFAALAAATMRDSNQFHAVCLDTFPPLFYLNETSHKIIDLVHAFNGDAVKAAYSFDAGPNATIFLLQQHLEEFLSAVRAAFPCPAAPPSPASVPSVSTIVTRVGGGPEACAWPDPWRDDLALLPAG